MKTFWKWLNDPINLTAISTLMIAAFTVVLAIVGFVQAWLTRQAIKLGREEFNATHRPRIKIRDVSGPRRSKDQVNVDVFRVVINNAGESPAVIRNYQIEAIDKDGEEGTQIRLNPMPPLGKITLASGEGYIFETSLERPWTEDENDPSRDGPVIVIGIITYEDLGGITRHTGFARETISGGSANYMKYYAENEYED